MLGIEPRLQVRISGVGRVDMVIGDRLVLEIDGYAYHSDKERFEADRRRDARLSARGYRVLRFSYDQIFNHWSEVKSAILAAIARGDHLASS
jgi:very-short-patch-repair endonuclease